MVLLDASARNVGSYLVFAASRRDACSHSDLGYAKLSQIRSERKRHPSDGQQCVRARKALLSREPRCSLGHLVRHAQRQPFLPPGLRSSVSRSPHGSAQQADASPQEHTHASVWIATSFRPRPRMHKHANVWWSMQLHELCALHTDSLFPVALAAVLSSCAIHRPRTTLGCEIALRANVIGVAPCRRHALRYLWQALARACSGAPRGSAARRPAGTQAQQLGL